MSTPLPRVLAVSAEAIAEGARLIAAGALVAFPTETVYGLGADATSDRALAALFAAKGRPRFNPLIIHFATAEAAAEQVVFDDRARALANAFWPGPISLVLARRPGSPVSLLASAGLATLAVRVPDHEVARALVDAAGRPVAAPSANPSGAISPTAAEHVARALGPRVALILDGGHCRVGLESTVVDLTGDRPTLLRPGGLPVEAIEAVVGPLAPADHRGTPRSPGMLRRHYAPGRPLRLGASEVRPGEALLAFGPAAPSEATLNLSPLGDIEEAAANLFAMLHALDRPPFLAIAVMAVPKHGLGRAINDRLRRAATPPDVGGT